MFELGKGGQGMTPRAGKEFRRSAQAEDLAIRHRHAAGIDVHSREHFVAVAVEDVPVGFINPDDKLPAGVRKFGTNTGDLEAIAAWLRDCGVTTVPKGVRSLRTVQDSHGLEKGFDPFWNSLLSAHTRHGLPPFLL
jgi:hypothetical protein